MKRALVLALALGGCAREHKVVYPPAPPPRPTPAPVAAPAPRPPLNPYGNWQGIDPRWVTWAQSASRVAWLPPGFLPPGMPVPAMPAPTTGSTGSGAASAAGAAGARYGGLSGPQCLAELATRGVPHRAAQAANGVEIPVRLDGPLRGVRIIAMGAGREGAAGTQDILDCRLALALDDFSQLLASRGVVRVDHMSLYRNNAVIAGKGTASQHRYGLAIDIGALRSADGQRYVVQTDWLTERGSSPCPGPGMDTPKGAFLRDVVCSSMRQGVFNTFITPNHNADHDNHFHFDVVLGEPGIFAE